MHTDPHESIGRLQLAVISLSDRLARVEHRCNGCRIPTVDSEILAGVLSTLLLPRTPFTLAPDDRTRVIATLSERGWSKSRIARALQISECSVYRCLRRVRRKSQASTSGVHLSDH